MKHSKQWIIISALFIAFVSSCTKQNDVVPTIERGTPGTPPPQRTPTNASKTIVGHAIPLSVIEPGIPPSSNIDVFYQTINGTCYWSTYVVYTSQWIDTVQGLNTNPPVYETFRFYWYDVLKKQYGTSDIGGPATFSGVTYNNATPPSVNGWQYDMNILAASIPHQRIVSRVELVAIEGMF